MNYIEFEAKYLGKPVDFDGVVGVQCVDLVDQYLKDCFGIEGVWCNGAKDLYNNFSSYPALVKAFDRVPNTPDLIVREGDIVIWGGGSWGHTGIGTGHGTVDWFITLEENTLGRHEPTQLVKHWFANDIANPCLGVLRPKKTPGGTSKPMDTEVWYRKGDKDKDGDHAIFAIKQRMKALGCKVDDTGGFGSGTETAVRELQQKWGFEPTGEIGEKFVKRVMK